MASPSFGEQLDKHHGFGPGFDFCRLILAFSVVTWHSIGVVSGPVDLDSTPGAWMANFWILPMFFGLSGFLVASSAHRLDLRNFLFNRGMRIFPALIVEVLLSALILGPILTAVSYREYFSGAEFFQYFLNIIGVVQYQLPGVFEENPLPGIVNGSLWTIPAEMTCYILISIFIASKALGNVRVLFGAMVGYLVAAFIFHFLVSAQDATPAGILGFFAGFVIVTQNGLALIPCFIAGIMIYVGRYKIRYSGKIAVAAVAIIVGAALIGDRSWIYHPLFNLIIDPLLVYIIVFLGLSKLPKLPLFSTGDYSYGIYLYGFPIQQTLIMLMPGLSIPVHLFLSMLCVTVFAAFSWHCIEKPVLRLRKNFAVIKRKKVNEDGVSNV